jgi:hypothetical protein
MVLPLTIMPVQEEVVLPHAAVRRAIPRESMPTNIRNLLPEYASMERNKREKRFLFQRLTKARAKTFFGSNDLTSHESSPKTAPATVRALQRRSRRVDHPQIHTPIPGTGQRKSRLLQAHPRPGMGLRRNLFLPTKLELPPTTPGSTATTTTDLHRHRRQVTY